MKPARGHVFHRLESPSCHSSYPEHCPALLYLPCNTFSVYQKTNVTCLGLMISWIFRSSKLVPSRQYLRGIRLVSWNSAFTSSITYFYLAQRIKAKGTVLGISIVLVFPLADLRLCRVDSGDPRQRTNNCMAWLR